MSLTTDDVDRRLISWGRWADRYSDTGCGWPRENIIAKMRRKTLDNGGINTPEDDSEAEETNRAVAALTDMQPRLGLAIMCHYRYNEQVASLPSKQQRQKAKLVLYGRMAHADVSLATYRNYVSAGRSVIQGFLYGATEARERTANAS